MEYKDFYVTKEFIAEVEDDGLDFILQSEFGIDNDDDDVYTSIAYIEKNTPTFRYGGHPINIDRLINTLQGLKEKGATHVGMEYHCDHISYPIFGYKLTKSTDEEVAEFTNKQAEKAAERIKKEKERLERELEKLSLYR